MSSKAVYDKNPTSTQEIEIAFNIVRLSFEDSKAPSLSAKRLRCLTLFFYFFVCFKLFTPPLYFLKMKTLCL